ncbi:transducin beta-like protein 2 isoform X4 [Lycorma delicatula]|uniref:transducin beta-like protein 2 isoform X4 n=1 Tax=Lycorma delicatula TaxID=130591 RepID=UPI003F513EE4
MVEPGSEVTEFPALVVTLIVGATILVIVYISSLFKSQKEDIKKRQNADSITKDKSHHQQTHSAQQSDTSSLASGGSNANKKKNAPKWKPDSTKQNFTNPWLVTSFKGHGGLVNDMDFSPSGKFLATCGEDRAIFIWSTRNLNNKEHKSLRYNIEYDHASLIRWSPDSRAFIINRATENVLEVYKVHKKSDGWITGISKGITFPKIHVEDTIGVGISVTGKYMMSCSGGTQLTIWDLKGTLLATVDTYLINTYRARLSPCGRFVAASGFAPDVKVWEVVFSKTGEFKQVSRAFELKGHSSGVYDFAFNSDTSRMATVSKDGTWKVFNVRIEFEKGEDPHLLLTSQYKSSNSPIVNLSLSPNGEVVAISSGSTLMFFSAVSGQCDKIIHDVYTGPITSILFDSAGDYVLTSGEKHVRVFYNVTGRRTAIITAKEKLKASGNSAATKERLQNIINDAEQFLIKMGEAKRAEG